MKKDLPFNWITWNSAKKSYQIQRGIESRLIQDLADYFNFTYHLINIRVFNPKNVSHESVVSRVQNKVSKFNENLFHFDSDNFFFLINQIGN